MARDILKVGFRAVISCIDSKKLDPKFAGRYFNDEFLDELPSTVDSCGENGEFHTFVFDGPISKKDVEVTLGENTTRDRFQFADILPKKRAANRLDYESYSMKNGLNR